VPADDSRIDEFRADVAGVRVQAPSPAGERRLLALGVVLMVAGIAAVVIGWYGASGTTTVSDQIPYLISGGLLGIALTVAGGVLFLRYSLARLARFWLIRLLHEERVQTDRIVQALADREEPEGGPS
jgi:hypothetical protein